MSEYTIPTTELDAVNELLASIQEAPITSLDEAAEQSSDAVLARQKLHLASRSVQSVGYAFNTDKCYPLAPTNAGEIEVPAGFLKASFEDYYPEDKGRFVVRGKRVYDRLKHTYNIARTLYADVTVILEYDDLPQAAKDYITKIATRAFQTQIEGETANYRFTREDIESAEVNLQNTDGDAADYNMFNAPDRTTMNIAGRFSPRSH